MPATNRPLSPIEQGTYNFVGALPTPQAEIDAHLKDVTKSTIKSSLSQEDIAMLREGNSLQRDTYNNGRRKLNIRKAAAVGATAVVVAVPSLRENAIDTGKAIIDTVSDRLSQDRSVNPEAGNPSNTDEIVNWDEDPSQTTVTITDPNPNNGGPLPGSPEAGQDS